MKEYLTILKQTKLFSNISDEEILSMLNCLGGKKRCYSKGEYVFSRGENINHITLLAKGCLHIQNEDYWGNLSIINVISPGETFGEAYIEPQSGALLNDVVAAENSTVIFFDIGRILTTCPSACKFHSMVIRNLFFEISHKNRKLVQKIGLMSQRTTREKLIAYLSGEARLNKSNSFIIPFNRQQLADFLSVDRSAMSNELCKMRDEGLIKFHKNKFTLM